MYARVNRILPSVDEATQRISVIASLDKPSNELYLNQYVGATIYTQKDKNYLAVKKSALTFFQNEWVVFVPAQKGTYEAKVVEIIAKDDQYIAIKGLNAGEHYVSDKSYYVKSMLLKSAIGEE